MKPGCPPDGWALRIEPPAGTQFLFAVLGAGIPTPSIIRDAAWKAKTRALGDGAVDRILAVGREHAWNAILDESHKFGLNLGLMPPDMRRLGEALPRSVRWGQSMLGNTMWVTGSDEDLEAAEVVLADGRELIRCGVDPNGARMVR